MCPERRTTMKGMVEEGREEATKGGGKGESGGWRHGSAGREAMEEREEGSEREWREMQKGGLGVKAKGGDKDSRRRRSRKRREEGEERKRRVKGRRAGEGDANAE